ncbi:MAG: hypothetical protein DWQ28_13045 [Proteobacteria bacterium]|nr:MAG: hypothetical protein DWQ28_13045 [Pseudomonadota bacterium]
MAYETGTPQGDGEMTFQQIGDALGCSRQNAKNIYNSAIRKLERDRRLKEYWDGLVREANGSGGIDRHLHGNGLRW